MVADIPFGFGTAGFETRSVALESVTEALEVGYRHVDTAQHYQYTGAVGTAIAESTVPREQLLVATKLHSENLGYEDVLSETDAILEQLGLDVIDLLYVHWPAHSYDPEQTFGAMEKLVENGAVRSVGGCNFSVELLREATSASSLSVRANQIEMHPFLQQEELLTFCRDRDIQVVAHSPLAGGLVFESERLADIAAKHDATVPQVTLAWLLQKDVAPVPKATGAHIEENYDATDIELDARDVERIDAIEREHRVVDYEFAPWNQ